MIFFLLLPLEENNKCAWHLNPRPTTGIFWEYKQQSTININGDQINFDIVFVHRNHVSN
jgi:hypothetical protein